jgi:GTPase SAR1 family protein
VGNQWNFNILIIGNSRVGKSSLIKKLITGTFSSSYFQTIGIDYVLVDKYSMKKVYN